MATKVFSRPKSMTDALMHYCPGCSHGLVHRIIAECIDELDMREKTIGIAPVGCSVIAYNYLNFDMSEAAHGRAPAVATGIKRVHPDKLVFTYQGDGDIAAIGIAEAVHAANRGENFTVIFVNNAIYGMTGGQMAPTTLIGQTTTTSPNGRTDDMGMPIKVSELLAGFQNVIYVERTKVTSPKDIQKTKKAIKKAFELQMTRSGLTMVEVLANCNTGWKMSPLEANTWIDEVMSKHFKCGIIKAPDDTDCIKETP